MGIGFGGSDLHFNSKPKKVVGELWANGTLIDLGQPSIVESAPTFMPALSYKEQRWRQCNSQTVLHKFMRAFTVMASPLRLRFIARKACLRCYSSSALKWEGGVSMVQGASRGIGLEFVKQLLEKNEKGHVVAACHNPNVALGLLHLKNRFAERLSILPLDLTIESTIEASAKSIREGFGSLNLLINASGILSIPDVLQPETTLTKVEKSSLLLAYEVNAVGLIMVIKHMWLLQKVGGGSGTERDVAVVANLSARVGSIGDNHLGGWHSNRSSKTALNQLTKTVSVEFARKKDPIICILLHPGTVDTDLSRPFQRNVPEGKLFTKEFSVQKFLGIINNAKSHDNGKFFAWDGQEIPW